MICKNKKTIINEYYIFLFILIVCLIFINFNWIKEDERSIGGEDTVLLESTVKTYVNNLGDFNLFKEFLFLDYPPLFLL